MYNYISILFIFIFSGVLVNSCIEDEAEPAGLYCANDSECPDGYVCKSDENLCIEKYTGSSDNENGGQSDSTNISNDHDSPKVVVDEEKSNDEDDGSVHPYICVAGTVESCYSGPEGTENNGICKAGERVCDDLGTGWSECEGEILPLYEICGNGEDEDCDGVDQTTANVIDIDGDGYNYCNGDYCEMRSQCGGYDPRMVNPDAFEVVGNEIDDNCDGNIDEPVPNCDSSIDQNSNDGIDFAKSMDLCPVSDDMRFGVLEAELLFPDGNSEATSDAEGSGGAKIPLPTGSYAVFTQFGDNVHPNNGSSFVALSTGNTTNPFAEEDVNHNTTCDAPADWFTANNNKFPNSPGCGVLLPVGNPVFDPVMLTMKVKVPSNAKCFSVDAFFYSKEFKEFVCSQFNDFYLTLLDTSFTSTNDAWANPADKNLAMDQNKNPVGVNLAMSGLFRACDKDPWKPKMTEACEGSELLKGTVGFEGHGGTGWLTTKGNIVPGETIELRFAIWDTGDHVLDSMVIIDNFKWYPSLCKPGTGLGS